MECPLVLLEFLVRFENHVSGPRRCKRCALTTGSPRSALCYQILALRIWYRVLFGSVIELPGFVSTEEAMVAFSGLHRSNDTCLASALLLAHCASHAVSRLW
uniref:Uncharacterized protein n=1 Tax=Ixodes ricinus TaxID=34613 RepID=A0A090XD56_IXORI